MAAGARATPVERLSARAGERRAADVVVVDEVAAEAPLEIQVFDHARGAFRSLAVVMRSPDDEDDDDHELIVGFLRSEGVVGDIDDIEDVAACTTAPSPEAEGNVWRVRLRAGVDVDWARLQRNLYASSSCGVCGKASIDAACAVAGVVDDDRAVPAAVFAAAAAALTAGQPTFARTGGVHAALAAECDASGALSVIAIREDVGRHNAVDKVLGRALLLRRRPQLLFVSGRISFEIVQKAVAVGVPVVAGVSAPTSLAVELATRAGVTLAGFVRGERVNLYSHPARVRGGIDSTDSRTVAGAPRRPT